MRFKRVPPKKLKVLTALFFCSGGMGIASGLWGGGGLVMTGFATAILCLGGLTGWMLLTRDPSARDSRKRRRGGPPGR